MILIKEKQKLEGIIRSKLDETRIKDVEVPLRAYDALVQIQKGEKNYGLSFCVGYDHSMSEHVYPMDEDIFQGREFNVADDDFIEKVINSLYLDCAILVGSDGELMHSGMYYRHDPCTTLEEMNIPNDRPLWQRYGFLYQVCTRHSSAISASFHMPETLVFVLSEEHNTIRMFHRGKIIYSPFDSEMHNE